MKFILYLSVVILGLVLAGIVIYFTMYETKITSWVVFGAALGYSFYDLSKLKNHDNENRID